MLRTKLAQRMANEFITKMNIGSDQAMLIAAGVDNGTMKAPQARMIAGLSADWSDAALSDATTSLAEIQTGTTANKAQSASDRATAASILSMAQAQELTADETRAALVSEVGVNFDQLLTAEHKAFLKA